MNLSETILQTGHLTAPSVPELRYLAAAAQKVRDRWPDVDPPKNEREREALALKLRDKVERLGEHTPLLRDRGRLGRVRPGTSGKA